MPPSPLDWLIANWKDVTVTFFLTAILIGGFRDPPVYVFYWVYKRQVELTDMWKAMYQEANDNARNAVKVATRKGRDSP